MAKTRQPIGMPAGDPRMGMVLKQTKSGPMQSMNIGYARNNGAQGNANSTRQRYMPSSDGAMMIGRKRGRPSNAKASFKASKNFSEADMGSMAAYGKTLKGLKNYTGK